MQKTAGSLHSASDILHSGWVFQRLLVLYLPRGERTSVRSFLLCTGRGVQTLTFAGVVLRCRRIRALPGYSSSGCVCHREMGR